MAGTTKRRSRPSGERREVHKPVDNEWEKEDEELDLEAQLFGRSKKRAKAGPSKVKSVKQDSDAGSDKDMDDVSCKILDREPADKKAVYGGRSSSSGFWVGRE